VKLLNAYLNNRIEHFKRTGLDEFGQPQYADAVSIKCRIENKQKLIRKPDGETSMSDTRIITNVPVASGDKIGERVVIAIEDMTGLPGKAIGYKIYL